MGDQVQKVVTALTPLAEKLGVAISGLWAGLVRYEIFQGITLTILGFLWFLASWMIIRKLYKNWAEITADYQKEEWPFWKVMAVSGVIILVCGCVIWAFVIAQVIPQIWAPDAYALKDVISMFQPKSN